MSEQIPPSKMRTFEKYFDPHHDRHYYFDIETSESIWELPSGADLDNIKIIDKTEPDLNLE